MAVEITVNAKRYEDHDDCLTAAAGDYADDHGLQSWEVEARWADDERDEIVLTVPAQALGRDAALEALCRQHGVALEGEGEDAALNRALPRAEARMVAQLLESAGWETSTAPDNDDPSMAWVYAR